MNNEQKGTIRLNLDLKGDKILYYKRKLSFFEKTIDIFQFWKNLSVWLYISFCTLTIFFLYQIFEHNMSHLPQTLNIFLFKDQTLPIKKQYLSFYWIIAAVLSCVTLFIAYKLYNTKKQLSYFLLITTCRCLLLCIIAFCKLLQMRLTILY